MLFVGVDVSKNRLDCAVITDDTAKLLGQRSFLNASEGIDRLLSWVRRLSGAGDASIHVVVEARPDGMRQALRLPLEEEAQALPFLGARIPEDNEAERQQRPGRSPLFKKRRI